MDDRIMDQLIHSPLDPGSCVFILINYQTKLAFTINSKAVSGLIRNAVRLAEIAEFHGVPTILTTIGMNSFGGPLLSQIQAVFPGQEPIDCDTVSIWENGRVSASLKEKGRKKLVMAGLWTNFSVALSAIQARMAGYKVYIVSDACGELNDADNEAAIQRMIETGVVPLDCSQVFSIFQTGHPSRETSSPDSKRIQEINSA